MQVANACEVFTGTLIAETPNSAQRHIALDTSNAAWKKPHARRGSTGGPAVAVSSNEEETPGVRSFLASTTSSNGGTHAEEQAVQRTDVFEECMVMCEFLSPRTAAIMKMHPKVGSGTFCSFFQSIEIISQIVAMVSIRLESILIIEELLAEGGCDICLVSATQFCKEDDNLSFSQLARRVRSTGCILLAYKASYYRSFVVNPSDPHTTREWKGHSLLAVLGPRGAGSEPLSTGFTKSEMFSSTRKKIMQQKKTQ